MALRNQSQMRPLEYCLTCGGTGKRGNLSGKKKCPTCKGEKIRQVEDTFEGEPIRNMTVCGDALPPASQGPKEGAEEDVEYLQKSLLRALDSEPKPQKG